MCVGHFSLSHIPSGNFASFSSCPVPSSSKSSSFYNFLSKCLSFSQIELSTGLKHQDGQECFLTSEENNDDKEVLKFTHCVRKSSGSFHQLLKYRSHIHSNPSMCSKLCSVVHKNSCKFDKALFLSVFLLRLVETKKSVGKSMGKSFDKVLEHNNGHEEINLSNKFEKL